MEMPKPGKAHEFLSRMAGVWVGQEHMYPSPWAPEGSDADAHVENRLALGGFSLIQDYVQSQNGQQTFEGHGVLGWDSAASEYIMHWWDAMGMPVNVFRGHETGGVMVLTSIGPHGSSKGTWDFSKDGTYIFRMEVSPDGEQWFPMVDGVYALHS